MTTGKTQLLSSVLIEVNRGDKIFTSSAVAISKTTLLTAAHSLEDISSGRAVILDDYKDKNTEPRIDFKSWAIHPKYDKDKSNYSFDLAIIHLSKPLPERVLIAELLAGSERLAPGVELVRYGYGKSDKGNVLTMEQTSFTSYTGDGNAITMKDRASKIGDSGGPIFIKGTNYLTSIHSTKQTGDVTFGILIPALYQWIKSN